LFLSEAQKDAKAHLLTAALKYKQDIPNDILAIFVTHTQTGSDISKKEHM
jgi:hypothetical protein